MLDRVTGKGAAYAGGRGRAAVATRRHTFDLADGQTSCRSPEATTGPVGWPVGEPPGGSRLMANMAPAAMRSRIACATARWTDAPTGMTPSETGFCPLDHPQLEVAAFRPGAGDVREADVLRAGIIDDEILDIRTAAAPARRRIAAGSGRRAARRSRRSRSGRQRGDRGGRASPRQKARLDQSETRGRGGAGLANRRRSMAAFTAAGTAISG